jgi:hypothetical protein
MKPLYFLIIAILAVHATTPEDEDFEHRFLGIVPPAHPGAPSCSSEDQNHDCRLLSTEVKILRSVGLLSRGTEIMTQEDVIDTCGGLVFMQASLTWLLVRGDVSENLKTQMEATRSDWNYIPAGCREPAVWDELYVRVPLQVLMQIFP